MQKTISRYLLLLKKQCLHPSGWIAILLMVFLTVIFARVAVPKSDNNIVFLYGTADYAINVIETLKTDTSGFDFRVADDEDEVIDEVRSGRAECGFIFADDMGERVSNGDTKECIRFITSSYTMKGNAAKELVYAAVFKSYSFDLAIKNADNIGFKDEVQKETAFGMAEMYRGNEKVFSTQTEYVETGDSGEDEKNKTMPVHGLIGMILVIEMLLADAETKRGKGKALAGALPAGDRGWYAILNKLAMITVPAVCGFILMRILEPGIGWGVDIVLLALFLFTGILWSGIISAIIKRDETVMYVCLVLIAASFVLAPILWDTSGYLPFARILRLFIPNGIYMSLIDILG